MKKIERIEAAIPQIKRKKRVAACPSVRRIRPTDAFPVSANQLLQRTYTEKSGVGICGSVCRQFYLRYQH